jgi:uncharacterized repeat protein (TIGR03803 family)
MSASFLRRFPRVVGTIAAALVLAGTALAQGSDQILYSFPLNTSVTGYDPASQPLFDSAGNIYGTANLGGTYKFGTFYELSAPVDGVRTFTVLHEFAGSSSDGKFPSGNLVFDAAGNIYGTAGAGANGEGIVYKLSPGAGGTWTFSIIYNFGSSAEDGDGPAGGLVMDAAGNLYGATYDGGTDNLGTVYELSPGSDGSWTEKVLYSFASGVDANFPAAPLVFDSAGNLYGTSNGGGTAGFGTVFEVSPASDGSWTEQVLYSLPGTQALQYPEAPVWLDAAGNVYTTAYGPVAPQHGSVFELIKGSDGSWTESILYAFSGKDGNGGGPDTGLVADAQGNLFGATEYGGIDGGAGTIYELKKSASGHWGEEVVYQFKDRPDGFGPVEGVVWGPGGLLYGVTFAGGNDYGTIYRVNP